MSRFGIKIAIESPRQCNHEFVSGICLKCGVRHGYKTIGEFARSVAQDLQDREFLRSVGISTDK